MSMDKYRKKPVVIEARQFLVSSGPAEGLKLASWCGGSIPSMGAIHPQIEIKTLEGTMTAGDEDWIIKGVKGEFYPCKPDIFEATYEPISPTASPEGETCGCKRLYSVTDPVQHTVAFEIDRSACIAPALQRELALRTEANHELSRSIGLIQNYFNDIGGNALIRALGRNLCEFIVKENAELRAEWDRLRDAYDAVQYANANLRAEVERLTIKLLDCHNQLSDEIERLTAEVGSLKSAAKGDR